MPTELILALTILHLNPALTDLRARAYAKHVTKASFVYSVNHLQIVTAIHHETRWQNKFRRKSCDVGLGQIHLDKCEEKHIRYLMQPKNNIYATAYMLSTKRRGCKSGKYAKKYCTPHWVQAYNGNSRGYAKRWLQKYGRIKRFANKTLRILRGHKQ